mmetsp:Transcript_8730/g.18587  ORF Transcript_8730/g.18587 Transcript_8730/m.18587 type:complete len:747 (-) Transcript_8730:2392-4632(-)
MLLMRPPEWVHLGVLILLELLPHTPPPVVCQRVPVLLEQRVDARDAAVPAVVQVIQRQPPVLRLGLLLLQRILTPHALAVNELTLPGLDVPVQVGDELVLLVAHAGPEVGDPQVRLLAVAQVRLGDQDVAHGQHAQAANLLGAVKHHGGEAAGHLGVEADLDTRLDLVLTLDQQVQQLLRMHHRLPVVGHEADEGGVPLVGDLGEGGGARGHEHLADAVLKALESLVVHTQEGLSSALLGVDVLKRPHAVLVGKALSCHAAFGQDADLETRHVEQQVWVVLAVHAHEAVVPLKGGQAAGQAVFHVPEHGAAQVHVVLHQPHARVTGPALAVVVADDVLVVGVRVLGEVALDQVLGLLGSEAEEDVDLVDVARVEADGVPRLSAHVPEGQELVGHLGRARHFTGPCEAQQQQVQDQTVVLRDEAGKLQSSDEAVAVGVAHVLVRNHHVVLGGDVVGNVVVHNQAQQPVHEREVHLLKHLLELALHHHHALAILCLPHAVEVVDAVAPLVRQQGGWLRVTGLYPVGEEVPLVRLKPQVLVQVAVCDLLQGLNLIHWDEVAVEVHELDGHLLELALSQQVALDALQSLVRVVVGLLHKPQLLPLLLVEAHRHHVLLLEPLQGQDEQLGVVLVVEGGEGDAAVLAALQPVHRGGVDGNCLLGGHVGAVLEVVVLPLLLGLEVQAGQAPQVLAAHSLVDSGAAADALSVVVRHVGPPVRLLLHVPQDHVLHRGGQARHLPGDVGLPAAPGL